MTAPAHREDGKQGRNGRHLTTLPLAASHRLADPRRRYGLTAAEGVVAALLAEAHSTARIAALLGVSIHTVRAHIRAIYAKTGVNRQAALLHLLLRTVR